MKNVCVCVCMYMQYRNRYKTLGRLMGIWAFECECYRCSFCFSHFFLPDCLMWFFFHNYLRYGCESTHSQFWFSETEVNYILLSVSSTYNFDRQLQRVIEFIKIQVICWQIVTLKKKLLDGLCSHPKGTPHNT